MNIDEMNMEQVEARVAEIRAQLDGDGEIDAAARRDAERTVLAEIDRLAGRRAAEDALKARAAQDRTGRNDR